LNQQNKRGARDANVQLQELSSSLNAFENFFFFFFSETVVAGVMMDVLLLVLLPTS
jgi:hypothetical protein